MEPRGSNLLNKGRQPEGRLQHVCALDVDADCHSQKRTGIICTMGPACASVDVLQQLIDRGMNICRIVMARGTHEEHLATIQKIREAERLAYERRPKQVAIAIDIAGPAVHIGQLKSEFQGRLVLHAGSSVRLTSDPKFRQDCDQDVIFVNSHEFITRASIQEVIYIEEGPLALVVKLKGSDFLECVVDVEGELHSYDECHAPGLLPGRPVLTDKDILDIGFGLENEVDMIFVSWSWSPNIIQLVRRELGTQADEVKVIAKIENYEGVKRYKEVLKVSDGTMVARGNLGIDLPPEKVFLAQKMMIGLSCRTGKPVICASQMLQSMIRNPRPTRAEASDIANAVLDGADSVMLSGETAIGKHPVKAVETLSAVCQEAEAAISSEAVFREIRGLTTLPCEHTQTTAVTAVEAAIRSQAAAIMVVTAIGRSACLIAQYRPPCHIVAITRIPRVARCLHLHRGVLPVLFEDDPGSNWKEDVDRRFHYGIQIAHQWGIIKPGDILVMVTGMMPGSGSTNTTRIMTVPDLEHLQPITNIKYTFP